MDRRTFLIRSSLLVAGGWVVTTSPLLAAEVLKAQDLMFDSELYRRFTQPLNTDRPFVRWWWNGNRVEAQELMRELRLLHAAGIGGVEINPVKFPEEADTLGKAQVEWLSQEWIEMLKVTFEEAKRLGMVCDLIVGAGWPFGGDYLREQERGQVMVIGVKRIKGPIRYSCSQESLFLEADPPVNHPYSGRTMELVALRLVPDPIDRLEQMQDLSQQMVQELIEVDVPQGDHLLYALVKIHGFMEVINGVPGANGPVVNHFDRVAVEGYLDRMSGTIERITGPLAQHLRAFFIDGLELEGANWCEDMQQEFIRRRGYDLMPVLPLTMYKTGAMGSVTNYHYGARMGAELTDQVQRVRYDFALTQAELLVERFFIPYRDWCRRLGVLSRAECYGRGTFPLNTSLYCDIPEGESWTTNWLKHRPGEEISNEDYRRGRAYTMINKYVSSAAHLAGRRTISAEDMTNTYDLFNMTLEFLKIGTDQSVISGVTHSVFHGFNYSPPEAPFPGWIRYGAYYSEHNNWWPYFHHFNAFKARLSALLQQADMYTDIAILPPVADMWSTMGMGSEPFPNEVNLPWMTLLWEAMVKHGNGCDYLSDEVILQARIEQGQLCYGPKAYHTLFLLGVERIYPEELERILEWVRKGGRVFCVGATPHLSLGWSDTQWQNEQAMELTRQLNANAPNPLIESYAPVDTGAMPIISLTQSDAQWRDQRVGELVGQLRAYPDRFIELDPPADNDFMSWYGDVQQRYGLHPHVRIESPDPFVMQNRYQTSQGQELVYLVNSHRYKAHRTRLVFAPELTHQRYPWMWDLITGERYRVELDRMGGIEVDLGPTESLMFVFDKTSCGPRWNPLPCSGSQIRELQGWDVMLSHSREAWSKVLVMEQLMDLKESEYVHFTGTVTYTKYFKVANPHSLEVLNLGRVEGISEVTINGKDCGVSWCGRRLYNVAGKLRSGENQIQIRVITTMGNYMRTLSDNPTAQKWTTGRKEQPLQSMGLIGPVTLYQR